MTDPLTTEQRETLRRALETESEDLREAIRSEVLAADLHRAEDLADQVRDPGDESVVDLLADIEYADIDRHVQQLRANEAAQRAWHQGGYGICVDCGEPIPFERLEAYPSAARCLTCQAATEKAGGPPPRL
ncbi:zinc finger DksA/TraR C4-type [Spiribacter salinus M19-40]|uniref:Zinc finger DksA/TraR C4-type n=1 Tax=Spiribacter salinus M19-40 TaxID=1260251 RepID=R4VE39_9GAMM|nr:TraR/DksA family transcriptional regulator [Spiribacter salinus]AGM40581.1 zinc finger DksA/TraR C4-type [Spiribacter salinus M19-40]MBY5267811.1 hypothetical protein [Spiribacter salinus]